jgi:hypothetical protein
MNILEELQRAGWDPFDPSEECIQATELPPMMSHLREMDRLGIYHQILWMKLLCRFGKGTTYKGRRGQSLGAIALLFALRRSNLKDDLTPEVATQWLIRVQRWRDVVLDPANERMERAGPVEVLANPLAYEPAVTMAWFNANSGLIDPERDRLLMGIGRAMHEKQRKNIKQPIPTSEEELPAYHDLFTRDGRAIARITDAGKIEIDPKQVKSAADSFDPERRRVVRQQDREAGDRRREREQKATRQKHGRSRRVPCSEPVTELIAKRDAVAAVRKVIRARLAMAKPKTARWHVLKNFAKVASSKKPDKSTRALAVKVGMDESTLREVLHDELRAIRAALKSA